MPSNADLIITNSENIRDGSKTLLELIIFSCDMDYINILVENNINFNIKVRYKSPWEQYEPLLTHFILCMNKFECFGADFLKKYINKFDVNVTDYKGRTALIMCAKNDKRDAIMFLIKNNADIDIVDDKGLTCIDYVHPNMKTFIPYCNNNKHLINI